MYSIEHNQFLQFLYYISSFLKRESLPDRHEVIKLLLIKPFFLHEFLDSVALVHRFHVQVEDEREVVVDVVVFVDVRVPAFRVLLLLEKRLFEAANVAVVLNQVLVLASFYSQIRKRIDYQP